MEIKRLLSIGEAGSYLGLGRSKTIEFCNEIGAVIHIGRRVLYDREMIDKALEEKRGASNGK